MARELYVVFVEDFDDLYTTDRYSGGYITNDRTHELLSVYLHKTQADSAAKDLAIRYPGKDVHVLKQTYGFIAPARPVETKIWTADGKYIPGTPE